MRAFGYTRVSTVDQVNGLQAQDQAIARYCEFKGLELANLYTDHGCSGKHPLGQRPRGAALLRDLRPGDHVVIHKLDRAWRNARDCLATVEAWDAQGVILHIVDMNLDVGSPMGRCFLTIAAAFAEMERRFISQRTKEGLAQSDKIPGPPPFGSTPEEAETLGRARWMRAQGYSYLKICRALDQQGRTTRTGKTWDPGTLRRILTR